MPHLDAIQSSDDGFTMEEMRKIFGFGESETLNQLVADGVLQVVGDCVTLASALAYLRQLLAQARSVQSAEDWVDDRLDSSEELLTIAQAMQRLIASENTVRRLISEGQLLAIPGSHDQEWLISPDSQGFHGVAPETDEDGVYAESRPPLTAIEQAAILGVEVAHTKRWRRQGTLVCFGHRHKTPVTMYPACMAWYLGQGRTGPGVDAIAWVYTALEGSGHELLTQAEVVQQGLLTQEQLQEAVTSERIPMIIRPGRVGNGYDKAAVMREAEQRNG